MYISTCLVSLTHALPGNMWIRTRKPQPRIPQGHALKGHNIVKGEKIKLATLYFKGQKVRMSRPRQLLKIHVVCSEIEFFLYYFKTFDPVKKNKTVYGEKCKWIIVPKRWRDPNGGLSYTPRAVLGPDKRFSGTYWPISLDPLASL